MCVCNYRIQGECKSRLRRAEDDAYFKMILYFLSEIRDCLDLFSTKMTLIAKWG